MSLNYVTIIDGFEKETPLVKRSIKELKNILGSENNHIDIIPLRDKKLAHCVGCFDCWLKTPGLCRMKDGEVEILKKIVNSQTLILLTPLTFGGYSAQMKKAIDRIIPIGHPYMGMFNNETHHIKRYKQYPRLVTIGVKENPSKNEKDIFKILTARNAINFHAQSFASGIITKSDRESLKRFFLKLLKQNDPVPALSQVTSLMQYKQISIKRNSTPENALVIVGSPKQGASNSEILGTSLINQLAFLGMKTDSVTLKESSFKTTGRSKLLGAVKKSDLIILAFPLYVDALPYLVTRALELFSTTKSLKLNEKRLAVLINNGFPESYQNAPALGICKNFATAHKMTYAGHLALGAGEALIQERSLQDKGRSGPPVKYIQEAINESAQALTKGLSIPESVGIKLAKSPVPFLSFKIWRRLFILMASVHWNKRIKRNNVKKGDLSATPYAT